MNRRYKGQRTEDGTRVWVEDDQRLPAEYPLPLYLDLANHSPTGFEWGYGGSGPAQLALAILADAGDDATALRLHQDFKRQLIAPMRADDWTISREEVARFLAGAGAMP